MREQIELAGSCELEHSFEEVLTSAVFLGSRPTFIDSGTYGEFGVQKVSVIRLEHISLPHRVYVCLPRLAHVPKPVYVQHDGTADGLVQLAIPLAVQGKIAYCNADLVNESIMSTEITSERFKIEEKSKVWIGYPQMYLVAPAPGLHDKGKQSVIVFTPYITQCFPQSHRRNADWQATQVAILDRDPLMSV